MAQVITKKFKLFDGTIGRDSPDRIKFTLKDFEKIHYGELRINIGSSGSSPIPLTSWKITKFVLNGATFFPSSPTNSVNIIHQSRVTCPEHKGCLGQHLNVTENILDIFHDSPLGSGSFLVPDIVMDVQLNVAGDVQTNPVTLLAGQGKDFEIGLDKTFKDAGTALSRATIPTIIILAIIAVIVIVIAYLVFKASNTVKDVTDASKEVQEGVSE